MAKLNMGSAVVDAINNAVNAAGGSTSRIKSNIYSSSNKKRGDANQSYDENGKLVSNKPAWLLEGQENKAEDIDGKQISETVDLQMPEDQYSNDESESAFDKAMRKFGEQQSAKQDVKRSVDDVRTSPFQGIIQSISDRYGSNNGVQKASDSLNQGFDEATATNDNGYADGSYMAAWDQYRKDHPISTESIFEYAQQANQDDWWNMMHDPIMQPFYQDVLDEAGDSYDNYFNTYNANLVDIGNDWNEMLKYMGTDADAVRQSIDWLLDTKNFVDGRPLFELSEAEGFPMPDITSDMSESEVSDTINNYGDIIASMYLENAAKNYYDNGMAGDAFTQAFTPEEISKLSPLEYWDVTDTEALGDANDVYSPESMNFHEITPELENELVKAGIGSLAEYGTPNTHMLPAINRASGGKYNYKWRNNRNAADYKNSGGE